MWIVFIIVVVILWYYSNYTIQTTYHRIPTNKKIGVEKKIKILQISDYHNNGVFLQKLKHEILAIHPDLIVFTGDMVAKSKYHHFLKLISWIDETKIPMFFSSGNHETYMPFDKYNRFLCDLATHGVIICDDEVRLPLTGKGYYLIRVCGISGEDLVRKKISSSINDLSSYTFNIVLMHQPECIHLQEVQSNNKIDIIFSGHAHGGQWIIPFCNRGTYAPNQGNWPKLVSGMYSINGKTLLVSRGIGTMIPYIPRIFNRPHLVCAEIYTK